MLLWIPNLVSRMHLGRLHSVTPWNPEIHPIEQVNKENHHHLISPRLASLPLPSISGMRTHWLATFCNSFFNSHPQQLSLCIPISVVKAYKHNLLSLFYPPSPHCLSSNWVSLRGQGDTHLGFKFAVEDSRDGPIHEWVTSSFCILATDIRNHFPFLEGGLGQRAGEKLCFVSWKQKGWCWYTVPLPPSDPGTSPGEGREWAKIHLHPWKTFPTVLWDKVWEPGLSLN